MQKFIENYRKKNVILENLNEKETHAEEVKATPVIDYTLVKADKDVKTHKDNLKKELKDLKVDANTKDVVKATAKGEERKIIDCFENLTLVKEGNQYKVNYVTPLKEEFLTNINASTDEESKKIFVEKIHPLIKKPLKEEETVVVDDVKVTPIQVESGLKENALKGMINDKIQREWDIVGIYQADIATLEADLPEEKEAIAILNSILDDKIIHIGMLQKILGNVDNSSLNLIKTGEEKAETIIAEPATTDLK